MQHNGQEYSLEPVKLSGSRFLYFKANACPVKSPLILPFGSVVNLNCEKISTQTCYCTEYNYSTAH